jgi:hypothetical protein
MDFQQGTFLKFKVTSPRIHLGAYQVDIPEGAVVEFDGQTLKWGGESYNVPAIKGAVVAQWMVPVGDNVSRYIPKPAGVKVRPAKGGTEGSQAMEIETTSDEEEVVTDYKATMDKRREDARLANITQSEDPADGVQVSSSNDTPIEIPEPKAFEAKTITVDSGDEREVAHMQNSTFTKTAIDASENEGVAIARFDSPAKQKTLLSDGAQAAREVNRLENSGAAKLIKTAKVAVEPVEGEDINFRKNGATGDVSEARAGMELEELMPDALSTGKPQPFDWDMTVHWRKRVALALTYVDRPEILKQILAVEAPTIAHFLKTELDKRGIVLPD